MRSQEAPKVQWQRKWGQALGPAGSLHSESSSSRGPRPSPETATESQSSAFVSGALQGLLP